MALKVERRESEHKKEKDGLLSEIDSMRDQFGEVTELKATICELEKAKVDFDEEKAVILQDYEVVKQSAKDLVEQVKNESEAKEFMVDRRMINTFLVQFLNPKSDEKTKHHMMSAMSKILAFTMDEK